MVEMLTSLGIFSTLLPSPSTRNLRARSRARSDCRSTHVANACPRFCNLRARMFLPELLVASGSSRAPGNEITDQVGAFSWQSLFVQADIVTSTTHTRLRGPRSRPASSLRDVSTICTPSTLPSFRRGREDFTRLLPWPPVSHSSLVANPMNINLPS